MVLFGDSITQQGFGVGDAAPGWAGLLAAAYARRADVLNRGFSGYNTRIAVDLLPSVFGAGAGDVASHVGRPLFVTVFFGANDAARPSATPPCQHVPLDEFEGNLREMVREIGGRFGEGRPPIILIAPPPLAKAQWDEYCMENFGQLGLRTKEATKRYGDRVKSVAKELSCSVVDTFSLLGGNGAEDVYAKHLKDGLHLNASGNNLLFRGLMDVLKRDFPQLVPMEEGEGKHGDTGIPLEGALWQDLCR